MYVSYFCPKTFYKGSQNEENCQISLLPNHSARTTQAPIMEQPQYLSAKLWVFLDIFQSSPSPPTPQEPCYWVGIPLGIFQPGPHPVSFDWLGISQYLSTEPHSVSRPWVGMPQIFHPPPQYLSNWEGAGNLLHKQIKLRISTNMGDLRTRLLLMLLSHFSHFRLCATP